MTVRAAAWLRRLPMLLVPMLACTPAPRATARPSAEFLVVSDDSTAWVRTAADTVVVKRAPMLLATLDARLVEIYVAEDPIEFAEATFLVTRVFRRDLVTGDSTQVFADSTVLREALAYVRAHPADERLEDDEPPSPSARSLEASITPMEVVGSTLGLEVHVDRTVGELGTHDTYRATVEMRNGTRLRLADLVPAADASATEQVARQHLTAAILLAGRREGSVGKAASRALAALTFDSLSFTLTREGDSLAARFLAHDEQVIDETRDSHRFSIEPVAMPAPAWWTGARATLPRLLSDSSSRIDVGGLALDVAYDSEEVAMIAARTTAGPRPVTRMRGPVRRVISVSDSVIQPAGQWRGALERAFSESGYYSDQVRAASLRSRARPTAARQAAL
ncbi:MAG: hypothetical protein V4813_17660 [Gemmatimonadota bacterium]